MDVNEYMTRSLALLERIANAVEKTEPAKVVNVVAAVKTDEKKETPPAKEPASSATAAASSTAAQTSAPADAKPAADKAAKPPSLDDARKALKAYAAVEGNEAAMELLASFDGAGSVSAVAELGEGKLAELIKKCKG